MNNNIKSLYKSAADDGLIMGGYLSLIFIVMIISVQSAAISFIGILLIIGLPVLLGFFLRRTYVREKGFTLFTSLWMQGILIFIFGSLICSVVSYIYLQYINPTFIYDQVKSALNLYESINEFKNMEFVKTMKLAIEQKLLPTPIQFVVQMIWVTGFFGSILSLFVALIVRVPRLKETHNNNKI